jgi:hypothetical protein
MERRGGSPGLQAAFSKMVRACLNGPSLDDSKDLEASAGRFPDFACFRDLLLIEMKHLETEQSDRINQVFQANVDESEMPRFYASRDGQHIFDKISNSEEVKAAIANKLLRTIEGVLSSANEQFASYRSRHFRKNSISLCVILNSTLREFNPDLVNHALFRKIRNNKRGRTPLSEYRRRHLPDRETLQASAQWPHRFWGQRVREPGSRKHVEAAHCRARDRRVVPHAYG